MQKKRCSASKKLFIGTLIAATTMALTMPPRAWAMLAPAETTASQNANSMRAADLMTVQTALESEVLRQRLKEHKLTPDQINQRLSSLSDAEVHQFAMQINSVNPGGDAGGALVFVLVVGILVLLFVYLLKRV